MSDNTVNKNTVRNILFGILAAVFLAAAVLLVLHLLPRFLPQPVVPPVSSAPSAPPEESLPTQPELPDNPKDFTKLKEKYPGIIGWISVPGTVIDYPIMRSSEDMSAPDYKEDYYLTRRPDSSKHKEGSIYIQKINQEDFSDPNTVIYGHNMASGRMFAAVHKFKQAKFFEENQYVYIYAPGQVLTYRIYSIFVYDDRHLLKPSYNHSSFVQHTLNPTSMTRQVREGITVTEEDRIITLSTCTVRDRERLLLEGVLTDVQYTK